MAPAALAIHSPRGDPPGSPVRCFGQELIWDSIFSKISLVVPPVQIRGTTAQVFESISPQPPTASRTRGRRTPSPRRGAVSPEFQLQKMRDRLESAARSLDLHEMKAALTATSLLQLPLPLEEELSASVELVEQAIASFGTLAEQRLQLQESQAIEKVIEKFWHLMQLESYEEGDGPFGKLGTDTVTQAGYESVYVRINKCVAHGDWAVAEAKLDGKRDWELDIVRFKQNATIANWMREIRQLFRTNAEAFVEACGWDLLFKTYDTDGSGVLDLDEFIDAARNSLAISSDEVPDSDIQRIFGSVDADASGEISAGELSAWLG
eukprot:SAG31_NODE_9034_length_1345_cov_1.145265_1_plen_321_part_10